MDTTDDTINPQHYKNHPSGIEIIELTRWMPFNLGNAFKYLARADHKYENPLQDLEKAQWYINDYAENYKGLLPPQKKLWQKQQTMFLETVDKFFEHESCRCLKIIHLLSVAGGDSRNIKILQEHISLKVEHASKQQQPK